jgi:transcriptional regulator with XRE-family HTH domain
MSNLVDAEPVRRHLMHLRECGMPYQTAASVAGVAWKTTSYLLYGHPSQGKKPAARIHIMNARRLLAVQFDVAYLHENTRIDGTGSMRRLQALVAMGWTNKDIADRLGVKEAWVHSLLIGRRPKVYVRTYRRIFELHRDLWDQQPPEDTVEQQTKVLRAQRRAAKLGYVSTLAWDDIDDRRETPIVDPEPDGTEIVDEVAVRRVIDGHASPRILNRAERDEAARILLLKDYSPTSIGNRLGMSHHHVRKVAAA